MKIFIAGEVDFVFEYFYKTFNGNDMGVHR